MKQEFKKDSPVAVDNRLRRSICPETDLSALKMILCFEDDPYVPNDSSSDPDRTHLSLAIFFNIIFPIYSKCVPNEYAITIFVEISRMYTNATK